LPADLILILVLTLDLSLSLDQSMIKRYLKRYLLIMDQSQIKFGLDFGLRRKSSQDFSLRL